MSISHGKAPWGSVGYLVSLADRETSDVRIVISPLNQSKILVELVIKVLFLFISQDRRKWKQSTKCYQVLQLFQDQLDKHPSVLTEM